MSLHITRIAGGMGVRATARGVDAQHRTVEGALTRLSIALGQRDGLENGPQSVQELYDMIDAMLGEPPTQIAEGVQHA